MIPAIQLYSMRDVPDQTGLLSRLRKLGVTTVEGYGGVYGDPVAFRAAMDENGLSMPSGHVALNEIEGQFDTTKTLAATLGMTRIFAPYLAPEDRPDTSEGWTALARRLNTVARRCSDAGLTFGWHNHDFEFAKLRDGGVPMDILLDVAPDITWEADLAWIERGGSDPLTYIHRYKDRLAAVHVKDIAKKGDHVDEDGWCNLGTGVMDWPALLRACQGASGGLLYVLEHDKPSHPETFAKRSINAFDAMWENADG
ncbi:sugar phosphate isomerase/epimerase family protein [Pseudooctadecabacter sp.]|uniref:sugar phosphate isomerase/epimerase family protein n=1 Tax=Pseudooctadecabacter sp. TaxID=1966338 RepID=UPI0025EA9421|nr:sugar phosphate isomerase/epimerase [Pseudooctadecabacter sp.]